MTGWRWAGALPGQPTGAFSTTVLLLTRWATPGPRRHGWLSSSAVASSRGMFTLTRRPMLAAVGSPEYPHILSTYRLTEHHLSGSMSRWLPWLAELQPELFVEMSPEHAAELGISNTDMVQISTPRGSIQAKALVTKRVRPYIVNGQKLHHVGMPWHWGYKGIAVGEVVNNLSAMIGDPNVSIHEAKVFVCNVSKVRVT